MRKLLFSVFLFVVTASQISAQEQTVNLVDFIRDTQQWNKEDTNMKMVWWVPSIYWEIASKGNPHVTADQINQIVASLSNYTIISALDGEIGPLGMVYNEEVNIKLIDDDGNEYLPYSEDEMSYELKTIMDVLKPTLANAIGQMGEHMNFYVFPYKKENSHPISDPESEGMFKVEFNGDIFTWKLPLGTLVKQKICPTDNEKLSGNWNYCPWHGTELVK